MTITNKLIEQIFEAVRGRFTYREIEELLVNDKQELIRLLEIYTTEEFEAILIPQIEAIVIESGAPAAVIELLPRGAITAPYLFSIAAPYTADYIREYTGRDIVEMTETTVRAIRQTIERDESRGINPRDVARHFRENIGLTPSQEQAVSNYRDALENMDRAALQRKLRDARFDPSVLRAIETGQRLPRDKIDKLVDAYRRRSIKSRSETIARTEQLRAVAVGQRQSMLQASQQGKISPRLRRFWIYTHDGRRDASLAHRPYQGLNPDGVKLDEQYLTQPPGRVEYLDMPKDPNGSGANIINCRCREKYT